MGNRKLVVGTRGSRLALTQAEMVIAALKEAVPGIELETRIIVTTGDRRTDVPLADVARVSGIADKGVFLKEIEQALETGEIDMAVHSLKDMPSELDEGFELAAVLPRAAVEDVLVSKTRTIPAGGHIATGSVRRRNMGESYWGNAMRFSDLRGNVPTRLSKLVANPDLDGIILARAGLDRLGLFSPETEIDGCPLYMLPLPVDRFVPAAGQGIVGIETRRGDEELVRFVSMINHAETMLCARAERAFLKRLGADCSTPVGVYAAIPAGETVMTVNVLLYRDGLSSPLCVVRRGPAAAPEALAEELLRTIFP